MSKLSLSSLLKSSKFPSLKEGEKTQTRLKELQLQMLRIQQGIWHQKQRAIIVFEGFDAAGKGGAIRRLTETLDPRSAIVIPVGPPDPAEQSRHYLYRFWKAIPLPGTIAVFDRSWYGRVLVERVEKIVPKSRWEDSYREISEFEKMLSRDGVKIIKLFLAIDKSEQLKRFEDRLNDPYKNWKLTAEDVKARQKWDDYVDAVDDMLELTDKKYAPWHLVAANDKSYARQKVLEIVTKQLFEYFEWTKPQPATSQHRTLASALKDLGLDQNILR